MGAIHRALATELGDAITLSQPVRRVTQDADGVTIRSDEVMLRADRVIVAVPIAIAGQIDYEPMLPADRSFLHQRMPLGAVFKIALVYDEPFWRADGLSGQSFAPGSAANLTIDSCTPQARPGIPHRHHRGATARRIGRLTAAERRAAVPTASPKGLGHKPSRPSNTLEQDWAAERYRAAA